MLSHTEFTKWLYRQFPNTDSSLLLKIAVQTNKGVAPEMATTAAVQAASVIFQQLSSPTDHGIPIPPPETIIHKFVLGARSQGRLNSLLPALAKCVRRAIELTTVDFTVLQTTRTIEEQREAVAAGNSRTMHSKHLPQADGFAHAVDLGVWVGGKVSWEFGIYADIAYAMDRAATEQGIESHVRWGCAWDRVLSDFGGTRQAYLDEAKAYAKRHEGSDLLDAPHFEWVP